jgi:hypothetical protein
MFKTNRLRKPLVPGSTVAILHSKEFNGICVIIAILNNGMCVVDTSVSEPNINCVTDMTMTVHEKDLIVIDNDQIARVLLLNHFAIKKNEIDKQLAEATKQRDRQPNLDKRKTGVSFGPTNPITSFDKNTGPFARPSSQQALPTASQAKFKKGDEVMALFNKEPFKATYVEEKRSGLHIVNFKCSEELITIRNPKFAQRSDLKWLQFGVPPNNVTLIPTPPAPTLEDSKVKAKLPENELRVTAQSFVPEVIDHEKNMELIDVMMDKHENDMIKLENAEDQAMMEELENDMFELESRLYNTGEPTNPDTVYYSQLLDEKA